MQIRIQNYEKCYPKTLKRIFISGLNYNTYNKFIPQMKRAVVGNIPVEIIKLFPKSIRGEQIKRVQAALSCTTLELRRSYHNIRKAENFSVFDENYRPSKYMKQIAQEGEIVLNSELTKIFGENKFQAEIKYAGFGDFANVYRLSLQDINGQKIMHDKALKVYHQIREGHPDYARHHNAYAESNFWAFIKHFAGHSLDKTQFTKHYISDLHSGYCLTEFIDPEIHKTTSPLSILKLFNLKAPKDSRCNPSIMGKQCDGGGYRKGENFTADKIILKYIKILFYSRGKEYNKILEKLKNMAQNPKTPNRDKIQQIINRYK